MDEVIQIYSFDGQVVWKDPERELFEVGNFLGGGAAGTVYECEHVQTHNRYALKILNPLGFKLTSPVLLKKYNVVQKGDVWNERDKLTKESVWWVHNPTMKQYHACHFSSKFNGLKELSLIQCFEVWGADPDDNVDLNTLTIPPKFAEFVAKRNRIFREICNMRKISTHKNVIRLEGVLELVQESKYTVFLVMELANGGELFDRIKIDQGTKEETALLFFRQLLEGVYHCHCKGVCHRDLKPENLLLSDDGNRNTVLKIADFGFSAMMKDDGGSLFQNGGSPLRILKSVVGSPFYVAPEVMQSNGYDGQKADVWSMGVIFYAMLAGNLPFGQDLSGCKRFKHFCAWCREKGLSGKEYLVKRNFDYPEWLFPSKFSLDTKSLLTAMLHPDPLRRISVLDACHHVNPSSQMSQNGFSQNEEDDEIFEMDVDGDFSERRRQSIDSIPFPLPPAAEPPIYTNGDPQIYLDLFSHSPDIDEQFDDPIIKVDYQRDRSTVIPPAFHDVVKKSSRFITTVPAEDVLKTVETILDEVKVKSLETPIGIITKIDLSWELFKLEIWTSSDHNGPSICAIQLYQMTSSTLSCSLQQACDTGSVFLVEFIRGQIDVFVFKRFYQWLRGKLSELVRRDYAVSLFESQQSPTLDSYMRAGFRVQH